MIKKILFLSLLISSLAIQAAASVENSEAKPLPKGNAANGAKLVGTCVACHGADGNSVVGQWPTLAGQRESYLFEQLEHPDAVTPCRAGQQIAGRQHSHILLAVMFENSRGRIDAGIGHELPELLTGRGIHGGKSSVIAACEQQIPRGCD